MSVIINAKGTSHSTFKVGKTGPTLTNTGEIVAPENSNLTISTGAGKGLELSTAGDVALIVTNNQTLNIAATNLQLNGTPWPSATPESGQYLTATADGTVWASIPNATVSKSGLMSASDKIRLDNATPNAAGTLPLNPLLIYYGFPIAFKGIWDTNGVIADISANYKYWVVGHTYQEPTHEEYASTTAIIQGVRAAGVKVYGYIPLGTSNYNYTIQEISDITDQWAAIGVDGIFLDEYGFDYGSTRQRQVDAVTAIHAKGLPICANAWVFEEFAYDTLAETGWPVGDWKYNRWLTYNPNDIASPAAPGDSFLIENFCYDNTGPSVIWDTQERASLIRPVATAKDIELWAVAVFGETTPGTLDLTKIGSFDNLDQCGEYISANAYLYDISIVGSGGFSFGSAGTPVWAPLYRLPANANVADYPASNNYTTKSCVRQFGPVNVTVVNDTTLQSVTVVGGDTNIVGDTAKIAEYAKVAVTPGGQPGYLWGTNGDNGVLRVGPGLSWGKAADGTHATLGINAVDGGDLKLQFKRLTRAELTAAEGAATVVDGEPYLVVDEQRIAIGTGDTTSVSFAKKSEVDAKLAANDPSVTNAREWTAATVTQAAAEAGTNTARTAWTAQRVRQAVAGWWTGAASKTTPVDADSVGIYDSAASGVLKRLTWANLKTTLQSVFMPRASFGGAPDKTRQMANAQLGAIDAFVSVDGAGTDWPAQTLSTSWWNVFTFGQAARISQLAQEAFQTRVGQLWVRHLHDTSWSAWHRLPSTTAEFGYLVQDGGVLGYGVGSGGSVTQPGGKSSAVTLNKPCGVITMHPEKLIAGASVEFIFYSSALSASSVLLPIPLGYSGYTVSVAYVNTATSVALRLTNNGATRSDPVNISFCIFSGAHS